MITIQKSFYQFTDVKDIKWYNTDWVSVMVLWNCPKHLPHRHNTRKLWTNF
jgi:hypothetical protein